MPKSHTDITIHLVFGTKLHQPMIAEPWRQRLREYMGGILRSIRCPCIAVNAVRDHAHGLIRMHPDVSIAEMARILKANSSKWIHETFMEARDFDWQDGYAAFSVSRSQVERVRQYIENQEEHHKKMAFLDELRGLLQKHGVEFDERDMP